MATARLPQQAIATRNARATASIQANRSDEDALSLVLDFLTDEGLSEGDVITVEIEDLKMVDDIRRACVNDPQRSGRVLRISVDENAITIKYVGAR